MNKKLDADFWSDRYSNKETGWDIGNVSAPLKAYFDQVSDKSISIMIPGCGNAYEAEYLLANGFTNITLVDISPLPVNALKEKLKAYHGKQLHIICDDFFNLEQRFDCIVEQTFFCALDPSLREKYVDKMHALLKPGGKLVGVLFNRSFEGGPPFGGNVEEYRNLFMEKFIIKTMEPCYNSISPRSGSEVFLVLVNKDQLG